MILMQAAKTGMFGCKGHCMRRTNERMQQTVIVDEVQR